MAQDPKVNKATAKKPPAAKSIGSTPDFELSEDDPEAAAAAFISREFSDHEESVTDATTVEEPAGQASMEDTIDTKMPRPTAPLEGVTQAFTNATIEAESMPRLIDNQDSEDKQPQGCPDKTIHTGAPKGSAKRTPTLTGKHTPAAGAAPAGAQKGAAMATTILAGKYKLLKKLGQGGMGSVYKAQDVKLERVVAVKVLAKELAGKGDYVQRFQREARVMVKLDHPNVIRCFDFDEDPKHGHFLAIEYVEGGSVEGWLKKLGKFSLGDALHLILNTAAGLQHAHEKSLIHRDVKPDNLLLTKDGVVKVADLGLAKDTADDTSLTKTGAGAGTPIYMAPEQARDVKHVDCRVDIYAMGVMLYVFLTGQPPFQGNTLVELITAKEKGKFDPMRKHNDEVPSKLDLIVDKMIARDPKNRYASCQEVIDDIEPLGLANEELSFIEAASEEPREAAPTLMPGPKAAATTKPAPAAVKPIAKTSVGGAGKGAAAKTTVPTSAGQTSISDEQEEVEQDVWYWTMVTESGKSVTKKLSTEQIRTLIKAGHMDPKAQISKSEKSGYRAAATYLEFQAVFKSLKTATKANIKGAKYRDMYKEIEEEDARRRKWGWLSRMSKRLGSTVFGLLWITLILALVGGAGFLIWKYMN